MDYFITCALISRHFLRFYLKHFAECDIKILKCNARFFFFFTFLIDYSVSHLPSARFLLRFFTLENVGKQLSLHAAS